jgi:short-subunit dehydrogenase
MKSYTDKTVLVTGASSGIGLAIAASLARRGADVILTARSTETLNHVAADIKETGVNAHVFPEDLSQPGAAERLHAAVTLAGLEVDLLVNNAGYGRWGDFGEFDRADYGQMIRLNITALTELCHLFIPDMIARGSGA